MDADTRRMVADLLDLVIPPSPDGRRPGAGALGITLGGPAFYHGHYKQRPALGEGRPASGGDIERAVRLVQHGVLLWLAVGLLLVLGGETLA